MKQNNFNIKTRAKQLEWRVKGEIQRCKVWAEQNPQMAFFVATTVVGAASYMGKGAIKHINLSKEESLKNMYCYDRSLGHYWKLRRELTNSEWVEIDKRKAAGERLADILDEMKVLK